MMRVLLLCALATVVLAGCDASTPGASGEPSVPFSGEAPIATSTLAHPDSTDLFVTFVPTVTSPQAASNTTFTGQDVRRRGYIQETTPGVAITVALADLPVIAAILDVSPLVASYESDITFSLPTLDDPYVPLRHDYTGAITDLVLPEDPNFSGQMRPWSVVAVGGHRSSVASGDGSGEVDMDVYVIDSGVDHPDINVVESVTFFQGGVGAGSTMHGNHVAGIIAARDNDTGMVGVAPGARIHSLDVFDASGSARMSQIMEAIDYAVAAKRANPSRPMVINMSLGANIGTTELNALDRAVEVALAERIPVVVAAGNQASNAAKVSPAHVQDAITVGAHDSAFNFAFDFSNSGLRIDVNAPGVRVISAADNGQFARLDGTSMAAPHVTGAVALILRDFPDASARSVQSKLRAYGRNKVEARPERTIRRALWLARL